MKKNHFYLQCCITWLLLLLAGGVTAQVNLLTADNGSVSFLSEAPLETIKASSTKLKAAIDKSSNNFAFSIHINSFRGFNNDLQREHFHENYMETEKLPTASFSGKLIDPVDFGINGTYQVRAKGIFMIHGVQKEKIIKGTITVSNNNINIEAHFNIKLEDFNIKVPKIVYEKIAEDIRVEVQVKFKK